MATPKPFRGSRKHILDLLDLPDRLTRLNKLLAPAGVKISEEDHLQPSGRTDPQELEIPEFCRLHCAEWVETKEFEGWWLPVGRKEKGATWDLLRTCQINGRRGLLLVEAKAHEEELDYSGKPLKRTASIQSKRNHEHICQAVATASASLNDHVSGVVTLSIESHYQLTNRVAWGWKLAECGVPVVLLYLGFVGDTYFDDCFLCDDHWQRSMGAYMHGVLPMDLPDKVVTSAKEGSFTMLCRSLPILSVSK